MATVRGKQLKVYLVDGTEFGPRLVEIGNWSGKGLYTPRFSANEFLNRTEFNSCGIYVLKSQSEDNSYSERVYIGESENLRNRLREHLKNSGKEFFTELVAFTSTILTKAHIRYLESRLITLAKEAKTAKIENNITTVLPFLPEADISDMEYFLEEVKLILPLMGFKFLIPSVIAPASISTPEIFQHESKSSEYYYIKHSSLKAKMYISEKGFIVVKGSQANKDVGAMSPNYIQLRQKLIDEGILIDKGNVLEFINDAVFNNISPASNIVLGYQSNGHVAWRTESGKTYKDLQEELYK